MTSGVLCCGNLVRDIAVSPLSEVVWGGTTWVDSIEEGFGGNGANTAYTLAKLGTAVRLLGMLGADDAGDRVLAKLHEAGVDTTHVGRGRLPTPTTVALVNAGGGRALLHRLGASREAFEDPIDLTAALIEDYRWFHLANLFALPALRPRAADLLLRAREKGLSVSIDTGWDARGEWMDALGPCLAHADVLFVNEDEARELTGRCDPIEAAGVFQEYGVKDVVVKLGPAGCLIRTRDGVIESPAFQVDVVDTTGAGDCFAGGFLAALDHGFSFPEAARFANAVGALSVQKFGGTPGLLNFDDTQRWIEAQARSSGR